MLYLARPRAVIMRNANDGEWQQDANER